MAQWIVLLVVIGFFILILVGSLKLIGERRFNAHLADIERFLDTRNLSLASYRRPDRADWEYGPITKPPTIDVSLGSLKILGMNVPMHNEDFYILETNEGAPIWVSIQTTFLRSPELKFWETVD